MSNFFTDGPKLIREYCNETLCIEPWGENSLRVRATYMNEFTREDWALYKKPESLAEIVISEEKAQITNGKIRAEILGNGKITFYNQKTRCFWRNICGTG
jgi:alpha-D-xyloside xylohydrolase